MFPDKYKDRNVRMFPDRNVTMFQDRSAKMFLVRNAEMFHGESPKNSADRFLGKCARMFHASSARMFPDRFSGKSVEMCHVNNARMCLGNNARMFPANNVLLPNRLMGNNEIFLNLPVFPALEAKPELLNNFQNTRRKFYARIFSLILISFRAFQSSQILLF